jgi:hypothetical protein
MTRLGLIKLTFLSVGTLCFQTDSNVKFLEMILSYVPILVQINIVSLLVLLINYGLMTTCKAGSRKSCI